MNNECKPVQVDLADQGPIGLPSFAGSVCQNGARLHGTGCQGTNGEGISTVAAWLGDASAESSQQELAVDPVQGATACPDLDTAPEADAACWGSPSADDVPVISIGGRAASQDPHEDVATPALGSIAISETLASMRWINVQPTPEERSFDGTPANTSAAPPEPPSSMLQTRADQLATNDSEANAELVEPPPSMQQEMSDPSGHEESDDVPLSHTLHRRAHQRTASASDGNVELSEPPPFLQGEISDPSAREESTEVLLSPTLDGRVEQPAANASDDNMELVEPQSFLDQAPPGPSSVPAAWLAEPVAHPLPQTRLGGVAAMSSSAPSPPPGLQPRSQAVSSSSKGCDEQGSCVSSADGSVSIGGDTKMSMGPVTALAVGHRSSVKATPVALITAEGSDDIEPVHCKVADLWEWLTQVKLEEYYVPATRWCADMGAVCLEEIAENIVDFSDALELKRIERQRVQKWSAQVLWNGGSGPSVEPMLQQLEDVRPPSHAPTAPSRNSIGSMSDEDDTGSAGNPMYTARTVRLAMDRSGSTGLDLQWNEEWGILVNSVDPLPGQPGLRAGDYIVAIDGCSLRHRSHEDCDAAFAERLQHDAVLNVVSPMQSVSQPRPAMRTSGQTGPARQQPRHAAWQLSRDPLQGKGRRGGYDANRMWTRFRGPPW